MWKFTGIFAYVNPEICLNLGWFDLENATTAALHEVRLPPGVRVARQSVSGVSFHQKENWLTENRLRKSHTRDKKPHSDVRHEVVPAASFMKVFDTRYEVSPEHTDRLLWADDERKLHVW